MSKHVVNDNARSPYQRYAKAPILYSAEYQAWSEAMRRGDDAAARRASLAHARKFAPHIVCRDGTRILSERERTY